MRGGTRWAIAAVPLFVAGCAQRNANSAVDTFVGMSGPEWIQLFATLATALTLVLMYRQHRDAKVKAEEAQHAATQAQSTAAAAVTESTRAADAAGRAAHALEQSAQRQHQLVFFASESATAATNAASAAWTRIDTEREADLRYVIAACADTLTFLDVVSSSIQHALEGSNSHILFDLVARPAGLARAFARRIDLAFERAGPLDADAISAFVRAANGLVVCVESLVPLPVHAANNAAYISRTSLETAQTGIAVAREKLATVQSAATRALGGPPVPTGMPTDSGQTGGAKSRPISSARDSHAADPSPPSMTS